MSERCTQPDQDCSKLVCGYPLPCPWHTAILHTDRDPPTVEIPVTAKKALSTRALLADVLQVVNDE